MFCKNCGSKLEDDAKFCPNCGCKVDEELESNHDTIDKKQEEWGSSIPNKTENNKKSGMLVLAIILAICAFAVVVAVAFFGFNFVKKNVFEGHATIETAVSSNDEEGYDNESETAIEGDDEESLEETQAESKADEEAIKQKVENTDFTICTASSELKAAGGNTYGAYNVIDNDLSTAWVEGVSGNGEGQWIALSTYDGNTRGICGIDIYGGYQKSEDIYNKNGKPTAVTIVLDDGSYMAESLSYNADHIATIDFDDTYYTTTVTIYINSAEAGTKYNDTAISEIKLYSYKEEGKSGFISPETAAASSDYILPDSDKRRLEDSEVMYLSEYELRIARNELYARHGRIFKDKALSDYFNSKPWYVGTIPAEQFNEDWLSDIEKYNRDLIKKYEER